MDLGLGNLADDPLLARAGRAGERLRRYRIAFGLVSWARITPRQDRCKLQIHGRREPAPTRAAHGGHDAARRLPTRSTTVGWTRIRETPMDPSVDLSPVCGSVECVPAVALPPRLIMGDLGAQTRGFGRGRYIASAGAGAKQPLGCTRGNPANLAPVARQQVQPAPERRQKVHQLAVSGQ